MTAKRAYVTLALLVLGIAAPRPAHSAPLVTLSGVVRDAYGTAVDNANLYVKDDSVSAWTITDGTGHYTLQVAAGSNALTLYAGDESPSNPVRIPRVYQVKFLLALSTDTVLDLTLPPVVDIEAHVTSASGTPVQGASVFSVNTDDIAPFEIFPGAIASGTNVVTGGYTDASGIAHLTCFPTPRIQRIYADYRPSSTLLRDFRDNVVALDSVTIHFVLDAPTPTLISATSELLPSVVKLRWYASDYAGRQVRIERCALDKTWSALSQGAFNGSGMLLFEDASVDPVMSYGYRVRLGSDDASVGEGEVWVTTIGNTAPGLTVLTNPSFGGVIRAHCQLPSQDGGTVELLDVAGRVLLEQQVTPTVSELTLRPNAAPPGIYFVRIRQGAFEIVKKAVVAGR